MISLVSFSKFGVPPPIYTVPDSFFSFSINNVIIALDFIIESFALINHIIVIAEFFQNRYFCHFSVQRVDMSHCFIFFHSKTPLINFD